jgi:hypothetical protein
MPKLALLIVLLTLLAAAVTAAPAAARTVEHEPFSFPIEDTIDDLCAFPVQLSGQSSGHVQVFRDDAGNFVKVILHFSNTFTLSANGRSVTGKEHYNEFDVGFDGGGAPSQVITAGLFTHIRLPDQRTVVVEAGRVVEDVATHSLVFEAGTPFTTGDIAALCAALS